MEKELLRLEHIDKFYGSRQILEDLNLVIHENEFLTLLGPSGCGKTTTLRLIGGFERPDKGRILFDGQDITKLPPERRQVNTVFQKYSLFSNMDVAENIAFGLKIKGKSAAYIRDKIKYALKLVNLDGYEHADVTALSGGQQQRIAIARAVVNEPKVLLLDEPLGALDLQLRRQMQIELKRLQKSLGITFIYITHDQEEALSMSDRIAVMKNGVFQQVGTPSEIYDHPKNSYVASFVGSANVLRGKALIKDGEFRIAYAGGTAPVAPPAHLPEEGAPIAVAVRSEYVDFLEAGEEGIPAVVKEKSFSAGMLRIALTLDNGDEIVASRHGIDFSLAPGDRVAFSFAKEHAVIVEDKDEE